MKTNTSPWPLWMGIRGFRFVDHGCWSDPEIIWHGHNINIHDIEDPMWELYAERCRETGVKATEDGFVSFCRKEVNTIREYAQEAIESGQTRKVRGVRYELHVFSSRTPKVAAVPA